MKVEKKVYWLAMMMVDRWVGKLVSLSVVWSEICLVLWKVVMKVLLWDLYLAGMSVRLLGLHLVAHLAML